ncbi:N-acetylneuraminate synthase family protein [Pinisolibacter sp. B13]|uniref:N-acetylneuraminate synthase family protein n=1 Tax=Pinisolibacter aquiterrae TaxID=2815579 RepID=UPI001C3D6C57|nr:N-acetylneuraminate synthase family protein [Pinisolibacter aquiterrae]MBV5265061.1 N-acetylneuraminate synthase family protein [Pinisolibacter aquiterrae]
MSKHFGQQITIGGRPVGDGAPCYVIAEIGSNHNQDFDLARRMIDAAAQAGADAVKFQTFKAEAHVSKHAESASYLAERDIHSLIRSLELDRTWQAPLQAHAEAQNVQFFSSPCDAEAVAQLVALGAPAHKVASFDLPDTDLIRLIARSGVPVILSTGLADWMDIHRGIEASRSEGNDQLVVLQCTSLYPAPVHLSNLEAMATIRHAFGVLTGYSDHTMGDTVSCAAVARGACMIEKHFTLDRTLPGPDHAFAMEPHEFAEMMRRIREIESAIGDGAKTGPRPEEMEMAEKGRRSLHARDDIPAGTRLTADMLVVKRPGHGIPVHLRDHLVGRTTRVEIPRDAWVTWDMV